MEFSLSTNELDVLACNFRLKAHMQKIYTSDIISTVSKLLGKIVNWRLKIPMLSHQISYINFLRCTRITVRENVIHVQWKIRFLRWFIGLCLVRLLLFRLLPFRLVNVLTSICSSKSYPTQFDVQFNVLWNLPCPNKKCFQEKQNLWYWYLYIIWCQWMFLEGIPQKHQQRHAKPW